MAFIFTGSRNQFLPYDLTAGQACKNVVNNYLVNGSTHALPTAENGKEFAVSVLPGESATVTGIGTIDNSANATIKLLAYRWISGTAVLYE